MKTRLVILIDFTPITSTLINLAKKWSEITKAEILFVHQITYAIPAMADGETRAHIIKIEKENAFNEFNLLIRKNFTNNEKVTFQIIERELVYSLPKVLGNEYNNLLVLGLKEAGFFKKLFIGSKATQIIDKLNYTIVGVPGNLENIAPQALTVALCYKCPVNKTALNELLAVFSNYIKQIHFICINFPKDNYKKNHDYLFNISQEYTAKVPSSFEIFEGEDVYSDLKKFISDNSPTMLVVQKESQPMSNQLFKKFLFNELVYKSSLPLIVIPI